MDRYAGTVPPDDEGWWDDHGVPEEHRPALAQYVLLCMTVHVCRAEEAAGTRYPADTCPGLDRVGDEAFERARAAIIADGGAGIARLQEALDEELRSNWPKRLPPMPDDDDDRAS
jgi:hypothetical protein